MMGNLKKVLASELEKLKVLTPDKRLALRRARLADYGAFKASS